MFDFFSNNAGILRPLDVQAFAHALWAIAWHAGGGRATQSSANRLDVLLTKLAHAGSTLATFPAEIERPEREQSPRVSKYVDSMKLFTLSTNYDTIEPWLVVVVEIVWSSKKLLRALLHCGTIEAVCLRIY